MGRKRRRNKQAVVDRAKNNALRRAGKLPEIRPIKQHVSIWDMWPSQDEVLADIREAVTKSQP